MQEFTGIRGELAFLFVAGPIKFYLDLLRHEYSPVKEPESL